jgi:heavy metal sensor kinase
VRRWWRSHSVRMRLTFWNVAAMIVVLGVYAAVIYAFVSRGVSQALDQRLRSDSALAASMVYQTPEGMYTWMAPEILNPDAELPWLEVWSEHGDRRLFSSSEAHRLPLAKGRELALRGDNQVVSVQTDEGPMRVLSRRDAIGRVPVVFQVARSEVPMQDQLEGLLLILVFGMPLAVAAAGLGAYALARRALAPIERMTERARLISVERMSERLPVHNPDDEMGRLAAVFNETLSRLEHSFDQMQRFTADVSHELRTPLTAIRSVGEVGLRGHRDEAAYRAIVGSMLEEADRLATLVDRLLTLSRAETGQAKLSIDAVDLRDLAENVASHLGVLAEERRQTIEIDCHGTPHALGDRLVLRQAVISLVDNAIKFSPDGGRIRIAVAEAGNEALVDIVDSGIGVPEEARGRIFDRFYRADSASAGTGLGLSIARGAVEANGGRLTLVSTGEQGSTFRIAMPAVR